MNEIALIVCVYRNDTLKQFLEMFDSIQRQTLKNFDIFIQMDGRIKTNLFNCIKDLKNSNKIVYFGEREENRGFAYSLNELIEFILKNRQYLYIARMDSDDICVESRLQMEYNFMINSPQIDVCGGWIEEFDEQKGLRQVIRYPQTNDQIIEHLAVRNPMAHVTTFFRRDFFNKVGMYDISKLNEDLDLWIRALEKGITLYNIQEVLVKVRVDSDFFSRRRDVKRAIEVMRLKIKATKIFSFGIKGYVYAVAHFVLFMLPTKLKTLIYQKFRG